MKENIYHLNTAQQRNRGTNTGVSKYTLNFLLPKLHSFTLVMFTGRLGEERGLFSAPGRAENKTKINKMSNMEENFCTLNKSGLINVWTDFMFS